MDVTSRRFLGATDRGRYLSMRQISSKAQRDRLALLCWKSRNRSPHFEIRLTVTYPAVWQLLDWPRPPCLAPMMVDRLAARNRQQPRPQVARVLEIGVGTKGGDEGLLEAVVGVMAPNARGEEAEYISGVLVEQGLKRRQVAHL